MRMKEDAMLNGQLKPAYNLSAWSGFRIHHMAGYQSTAYGYEDLDPIPERYGVVSSV